MEAVKSSYKIEFALPRDDAYNIIEIHGRKAWQSQDNTKDGSAAEFIKMIIAKGHESVLEHSMISVSFIIDRSIAIELRTHRLASHIMESTRYCAYKDHLKFVIPWWLNMPDGIVTTPKIGCQADGEEWLTGMLEEEARYHRLLADGWSPQKARAFLPGSLRAEMGVTANFREWRHIQKLRTDPAAHPDMRKIMIPLFKDLAERYPEIFGEEI